MDISIIAKRYHIKAGDFEQFLVDNKLKMKSDAFSIDVPDSLVVDYVTQYAEKKNLQISAPEITARKAERTAKAAEEARKTQQKNAVLSKILISSGFNFEGYSIVKYSGYISGDDSVQISRSSAADHGADICKALVKIRRQALLELKEAAYNLGCNAVIGVDFDYITLEPQTATGLGGTLYEPYVICVTANGNAVVIEKKE